MESCAKEHRVRRRAVLLVGLTVAAVLLGMVESRAVGGDADDPGQVALGAQIYGAAIGAWGSPLLSSATLQALCAPLVAGVDGVLRVPTRFAAGVMSHTRDHRPGQLGEGASDQAFGHPGMGGSLGAADPAAALAFGYTMNRADLTYAICHMLGMGQQGTEKVAA